VADVVSRVSGGEVLRRRVGAEHRHADALDGDRRVAHHFAIVVKALDGLLGAFIAEACGLRIVLAQVPRQLAERPARCDRHDVAEPGGGLDRQLEIGVLGRQLQRALALDHAGGTAEGEEHLHDSFGIDLVHEQVGVVVRLRPDLHRVAGFVHVVVTTVGPDLDRKWAGARAAGRDDQRQERGGPDEPFRAQHDVRSFASGPGRRGTGRTTRRFRGAPKLEAAFSSFLFRRQHLIAGRLENPQVHHDFTSARRSAW
jgi:hypothetical protein